MSRRSSFLPSLFGGFLAALVVVGAQPATDFGMRVARAGGADGSFGDAVRAALAEAVASGSAGDVTGVTAGAGLTGGATSGAASLAVGAGTGLTVGADDVGLTAGTAPAQLAAITTAVNGTLAVYAGSAGWQALAPGTAGQVLESRLGTHALGLGWATASSPARVYARYGSDAAQTINGATRLNFEDVQSDTLSTVTIGGSWVFTAPRAGVYSVAVNFPLGNSQVTLSAGATFTLAAYKNGSRDHMFGQFRETAGAASVTPVVSGHTLIALAANDTIYVECTSSESEVMYPAGTESWIAIVLVSE